MVLEYNSKTYIVSFLPYVVHLHDSAAVATAMHADGTASVLRTRKQVVSKSFTNLCKSTVYYARCDEVMIT